MRRFDPDMPPDHSRDTRRLDRENQPNPEPRMRPPSIHTHAHVTHHNVPVPNTAYDTGVGYNTFLTSAFLTAPPFIHVYPPARIIGPLPPGVATGCEREVFPASPLSPPRYLARPRFAHLTPWEAMTLHRIFMSMVLPLPVILGNPMMLLPRLVQAFGHQRAQELLEARVRVSAGFHDFMPRFELIDRSLLMGRTDIPSCTKDKGWRAPWRRHLRSLRRTSSPSQTRRSPRDRGRPVVDDGLRLDFHAKIVDRVGIVDTVTIGTEMNGTSRQSCNRPMTRIGTVITDRIDITIIETTTPIQACPTSVSPDTDPAVCPAVVPAPMPTSTHRRAPKDRAARGASTFPRNSVGGHRMVEWQ